MGGATGTTSHRERELVALGATESTRRDLQRLLSDTVQRLRRNTSARGVAAWALQADGRPYLAAADFADEPPVAPTRELFDQIAALPHATHLREDAADDAQIALSRQTRADAVAPIVAAGAALGTPAMAALLLDGETSPATLAALEAAAQQVARPLSTALALGRLAQLDVHVRELDRLAALGALAGEVAHEVRNPLVTLTTFVEVLPDHREDPEFLTRYRDVVREELRRMSRLLDLVAEHAQPEAPADDEGDLGAALAGVLELLRLRAAPRHIEVELDGVALGCRLRLSEDALRQVLFNLLHNAIEATPDGGSIQVAVRPRRRDAEVEIRDQGPGIPPALRERVFEPFVTTREGGVGGLGLAISRRIVDAAGGEIRVAEAPGGGAAFTLRLPRL